MTDIVAPVTVVPKIKTFTLMNGTTIINGATINYDNMGRRIKQTTLSGSWFDFTFSGSSMIAELFNTNGASANKSTYILNAYGAAVSYYPNTSPTIVTNLTYNTANQPLTQITNNNGTIDRQEYYTYDNAGNRITDSLIQVSGTTIRTYEYYTDKISTISNINFGDYADGAGNKNCLKKVTSKSPLNVLTATTYSIPEMDAQARVTKQSYTTGGATTDYLYTYY